MSNPRLHNAVTLCGHAKLPERVAACGLKVVTPAQLDEARTLAEQAMGRPVAPLSALRQLSTLAPASILIFEFDSRVTGVLGVLPLTACGLHRLVGDALDLADPQADVIANAFDEARALYAMGIAAEDKVAARAVVTGVVRLRKAFPAIPFYARPVTGAGRRVLIQRLRCVAVPASALMVSPAQPALEAAA